MINLIIPTLLLLFSGSFGLYSMHRNDSVVNNKYLYLYGWFFFAGVAVTFIFYVLKLLLITELVRGSGLYFYVDNLFAPITTIIISTGMILHGLYLYSLKRPCMMPQYLPRTAKIFLRKKLRRLLKFFKIKYFTNNETEAARLAKKYHNPS